MLETLRRKSFEWNDRQASRSLLWRLLRENLPEHKGRYLAAVAAMILVAVTTSMSAWIMGEIVDAITDVENRARIFLVAGMVFAIFFFKGLATFAQVVLMARAGNRIVAAKQTQMYRKLLGQGVSFFSNNESSDLLMKVTQSANMARQVIDTMATGFIRDMLTLIGLVAVMFYQQPLLSLVGIVIGPVVLYSVRLILKKVRDIMQQELAGLSEIIRVVQETSVGARVIKAFALEELMYRRMETAVVGVEKRQNKIARLEAATTPLMDSVTGFAIASIVLLSSVSLFGDSVGTPGQLMSFVTAFLMAYEPAKRLSRMRVSIETGMVGVRMMYELLDAPETMSEAQDAKELPKGPGQVMLEDVHYSYGGTTKVIDGVTMEFPAGKTTALVGPSGGGKSTLLNIMLRLFDPDCGRVLIDGTDLRKVKFSSLRERISYVGQDTFLFSNSVMENLRVARNDATDEEVIEAAKVANADEFIRKLPQGYNTPIGENGAFLSGGQRQRLAIARAVLRRAQILILDEATSALDSHSEALVKDALDKVTENVTTIVVAHRLATVLQANKICYIENGTVREAGSFSDLMKMNGKFKALYDRQSLAGNDLIDVEEMHEVSTAE